MKKKALSLALALVMCLSLVPSALAANGYVFIVRKDSSFKTVDDLKSGNVIGVTGNHVDAFAEAFAESGYLIAALRYSDFYLALQQGRVDAVVITSGSEDAKYFVDNGMRILDAGFAQQPANPSKSETAMPTNDKLTVNGRLADPTVYKIGDSNYFKIRDVAALLDGTEKQFAVGYDNALKSVTATTGQGYAKLDSDLLGAATGGNKAAEVSNDTVYVNGQKIDAQVYKIDGGNYFKLRDLGKALNFSVDWTKEAGMMIDTGKPYTE